MAIFNVKYHLPWGMTLFKMKIKTATRQVKLRYTYHIIIFIDMYINDSVKISYIYQGFTDALNYVSLWDLVWDWHSSRLKHRWVFSSYSIQLQTIPSLVGKVTIFHDSIGKSCKCHCSGGCVTGQFRRNGHVVVDTNKSILDSCDYLSSRRSMSAISASWRSQMSSTWKFECDFTDKSFHVSDLVLRTSRHLSISFVLLVRISGTRRN